MRFLKDKYIKLWFKKYKTRSWYQIRTGMLFPGWLWWPIDCQWKTRWIGILGEWLR